MYGLYTFLLLQVLAWPRQNVLGSEIINGKNVPENSMPYMASVRKGGEHVCGGFLVSDHFVVTAARCDDFLSDVKTASVVLGTNHLDRVMKTEKYIEKKCKHPSYKHFTTGNDIMLLKLGGSIEPIATVKQIPLPTSEFNINGTLMKCHVAGWGWTETVKRVVNDLMEVGVSIINSQDCKRMMPHLPANVICGKGGSGFCQGDFGGPLVCNGTAVGVASYIKPGTDNCVDPEAPNVYTDIFKFLTWINGILQKQDC